MKPNGLKPKRLRVDSIYAATHNPRAGAEKDFIAPQMAVNFGFSKFFRLIFAKDYAAYLIGFISLIVAITVFVGATLAYFSDQESGAVYLKAGSINLDITSPADFAPVLTEVIPSSRTINLANIGSLKSAEAFFATTTGSDLTLCNNLLVDVIASGASIYHGPLIGLSATTTPLATSSSETIILNANIATSSIDYINKTCNFDLIFYAWQDINPLPDPSKGYIDRESLSSVITTDPSINGIAGLAAGRMAFGPSLDAVLPTEDVINDGTGDKNIPEPGVEAPAPDGTETAAPQSAASDVATPPEESTAGDAPEIIENPEISNPPADETTEIIPPEEPLEIIFDLSDSEISTQYEY